MRKIFHATLIISAGVAAIGIAAALANYDNQKMTAPEEIVPMKVYDAGQPLGGFEIAYNVRTRHVRPDTITETRFRLKQIISAVKCPTCGVYMERYLPKKYENDIFLGGEPAYFYYSYECPKCFAKYEYEEVRIQTND